ncbi:MAG: hypothetical protein HGB04_10680 [Chlorobiaceae bacterium]|nr:hypothetical protein [Chlorobiaceae bacterium]
MMIARNLYSESEAMKITGYSRQQLRYLRLGRRDVKYRYKPVLIEGEHWIKLGRAVVYTLDALELLKKRKAGY